MKKVLLVFCLLLLNNQAYSNSFVEKDMDLIHEAFLDSFNHDYSKKKLNVFRFDRPIHVSVSPFKLKYCKNKKTNSTFTVINKHSCNLPIIEGNKIKIIKGKKISKKEFDKNNPNFLESNNLICIKEIKDKYFPYLVFFLSHTLDNKIYLNSLIPARMGLSLAKVDIHDVKQKGIWMHQGIINDDTLMFMRYYDKNSTYDKSENIYKTSSVKLEINYNFADKTKCYANNEYWIAMHPDLAKGDNEVAKIINNEQDQNDEKKLEEEKKKAKEAEEKRIAEEKRKAKEEEEKRIAEAKKKEEEAKQAQEEELYVIGSGTGFFVNDEGYVVTNEHVAGICQSLASYINGKTHIFNILALDNRNDLALLRGEYRNKNFLNINPLGAEFGQDIMAFGFPLAENLSSSVKLTRGIVSSLSGPENDISLIQIDAAIQPGNSGGPVLNYNGQVVGVASSGLNKVQMLLDEESPYIPENVNFAVAATTLTGFLKSNSVKIFNESFDQQSSQELAKIGMPPTIQLHCLNTIAAHNQLRESENFNDVLLKKVVNLK